MYYYYRPLLLSGVCNFNCLFSVQTVNTCQSTQQSLSHLLNNPGQARNVHSLLTAVSKRLSLKRLRRFLSTSAPVLKMFYWCTGCYDVLYFMNSFLTSGSCLSNMRTSLSLSFRYNRCFCELASAWVR